MVDERWYHGVTMPALLRAAREAYGAAIRAALRSDGFEDVPRNGAFVLGGMDRNGSSLGEVIKALHLSKQAGGQLVDTLVTRGYLDRTVDPTDRRRLSLSLTERGTAAAAVIRGAVEGVDGTLAERRGAAEIAAARKVLAALIVIRDEAAASSR